MKSLPNVGLHAAVFLAALLFRCVLASSPLQAQVRVPKLVRLTNTTHPLATQGADRGKVPDDFTVDRVLVVMKDSAQRRGALDGFLAGLQNPLSPDYRRWLKPEEFGQRFGAPQPDIAAVSNWLATQGLRVNRIAKGRGVVEFSGTAGAVGQAFHTEIHNYSVEGHEYWANQNDISVPEPVAAVIEGVVSLNSFHDYKAGGEPRPGPEVHSSGDLKPQYRGGSGRRYLAPADFASIYNVPSTYTGAGVTIAVVGDNDFDTDDIGDVCLARSAQTAGETHYLHKS